jgi:hypothetical protein
MSTLLREQLSAVRSSLGAVNNTLADVEYNENLLKEGINKVTKYMEMLGKETNEKVNIISMKIEVEEHILQCNLDRLMDSVMNAQKAVIQPQIVSPATLMEVLSVSAFPKDTTLPFPLSKDSVHFIFRICELQVYVKDGILGYVVSLPLASRANFNIYRLIPIPVPLGRSKFL